MLAKFAAHGVMPSRGPRHVSVALAILGAVLLLTTLPGRAHAATFTPSTPAELISAITTANSNGQDDVIDLGGGTFTLTAVNNTSEGANGLPSVLADGGHKLTIRNGVIQRQGSAPGFRLLHMVAGADVTLDTVTLTGALSNAGGLGDMGGAVFSRGALTIVDSTFTNNTASGIGGLGGSVVSVETLSTLTVTRSTFTGNTAASNAGGAIQNTRGTVSIVDSTFNGNTALNGGAIETQGGTLTVTASTIHGNTATSNGGGLYVGSSAVTTLVNVTLTGNSASIGGGALHNNFFGDARIVHSTLSGNSAPSGGGIYNDTSFGSTVVSVRASVLDTGSSGANCAGGAISSLGSNVIDDNTCGFAQTGDVNNATLNLGALQDNGGPTHTLALGVGSAAIDAVQGFCTVDGTFSGVAVSTDQRGAGRPKGAACDAGAFESGTLTPGTLQFSAATFTVGEAGPTASVTVTRTGGSEFTVGATVTVANGTATAPADFDNTARTVSFAGGDTTAKTVLIPIVNDALDEADEIISLTLGSPTGGATLGAQTSATLTITDDDLPPTVSVNDVTQAEGNAGSSTFTFTVSLSAPSGRQVTVQAQTADGSALVASGDYAATGPTTLTFVPGDIAESFVVQVNGNLTDQEDRGFFVNLSSATNATILDNQGLGTITDDDNLPSFSIAGVTVAEGDSGSSAAQFVVTRTGATALTTSVQYATADGTAAVGSDYGAASGTLTFLPNESAKTVSVSILGDTSVEADEAFTVTLTNATNATIGSAQATGTISNDDGLAVLSIAGVTVGEGGAGQTTAQFTVTRAGGLTSLATVQFATSDGTASAGSDYATTSGTLTFAPGDATKTISVVILGDTIVEGDETFTVTLSNPTNATLGTAQATGTISNDDIGACTPRPRVTQTLTADGSKLTVRVEATPLNTQANNPLQQIRFGTFQNALVRTADGHPVNSGQTLTLPSSTIATTFVVRRVTAGQAATVPFTVVDGCGEWQTFVGGGTGAGF